MRKIFVTTGMLVLLAAPALADDEMADPSAVSMAPPAAAMQAPEMVTVPWPLLDMMMKWSYEAGVPAKMYDLAGACINDNPHTGAARRKGPDLCPAVTMAFAARAQELADLRQQLEHANKRAAAPKSYPTVP